MAAYWPHGYYAQYTPFYGGQAYIPPQYPPLVPGPMMPAMSRGLPLSMSSKWPKLNSLLGTGETLVRFDVRKHPSEAILAGSYHHYGLQPAIVTASPVMHLRIYSKSFPWTIDIISKQEQPITCRHIWEAVHDALQQELDDSEWGMIVRDKKLREATEKAAKKRMEEDKSKKLKRIDVLGEATLFKGLEKDGELEKVRLLPGTESCPETWFATFST
ncbi:hypothetical protein AX15_005774 [Amanita polypyramis BW_CC]|nr:hypothetical protein AX15_005774 [Amanita polypyramis BW_CC]